MLKASITSTVVAAAAVLTAGGALAQAPLGSAFTYQGQLKQSGDPAEGTYDMRFRLYDAATGGLLVATTCVDGVTPVDGLFTVQLDFGALAFDGSARWMEIGVRPDSTPGNCAGGAAYTTLTPRQSMTAVPYALFALGGPGGGGGFWQSAGTAIMNSNTGFVGIRRSTPVTGSEYFGIQTPDTSGYGGMYIRTDGTAALPFYGYRAGTPTGETAWTYLDGTTGDWRVNVDGDRLTVTDTGFVGIGTTSPSVRLTINTADAVAGIRVQAGPDTLDISDSSINTEGDGFLGDPLFLNDDVASNVIIAAGGGHCGIGTGVAGLPVVELQVDGGDDASLASVSGGYFVIGATNGPNLVFDNNEFMARNDGAQSPIYINHEGGDVNFGQGGGTCVVRVPVLEITGADLAEKFPVSDECKDAVPGTVMEIDPDREGKLRVSRGAYNRRVAGVVSGAGDIPVGAILGNLPGHEGAPPIALTGRVWVMCDASDGAIQIGDLLTTAESPGCAMRVSDYPRAQGAIIGKAMSGLAAGERGLVRVLVSLQ